MQEAATQYNETEFHPQILFGTFFDTENIIRLYDSLKCDICSVIGFATLIWCL
jgi:hypothetical protein